MGVLYKCYVNWKLEQRDLITIKEGGQMGCKAHQLFTIVLLLRLDSQMDNI